MSKLRDKPQERRQYPREPVKQGTIAVGPHTGEIIDISMGGMAFSYLQREDWDGETFERGILLGEDDLYVEELPFKVISDCAINSGISIIRRCGVQFGTLTPKQMAQLEYFIWANANAQGNEPTGREE